MKKFKKVIALCLAAMAAVSAMSMSAFAEDINTTDKLCKVYITDANGYTSENEIMVSVPNTISDNEVDNYLQASVEDSIGVKRADSVQNSSIMPYASYPILNKATTFSRIDLPHYTGTSTYATVFSNYKLGDSYDYLEILIKKTSGSFTAVNARLTRKSTIDNKTYLAAETNEPIDSNYEATFWFVHNTSSEMSTTILNTSDIYSLHVSGYNGSGRANVTVTPCFND